MMTSRRHVFSKVDDLKKALFESKHLTNDIFELELKGCAGEFSQEEITKLLKMISGFPCNFCVSLKNFFQPFEDRSVGASRIPDKMMKQIASLLTTRPDNFELKLSNVNLTPDDLALFKNVLKKKNTGGALTLNFENNDAILTTSAYIDYPIIKSIYYTFFACNFNDEITGLIQNAPKNLTLNLSACGISDRKLHNIVGTLIQSNPERLRLILHRNRITDKGLENTLNQLKSMKDKPNFYIEFGGKTFYGKEALPYSQTLLSEINECFTKQNMPVMRVG